MARISAELKQQILDKTDFLAVYQEHVRLQKKGASYWGLCPFHSEKTPSFSVSAETGLFYCFGCHKGGSVIQFLMDVDKLGYSETMEELARRAGIQIHFEESEHANETEKNRQVLLELYERLTKTFQWFLLEHPSGSPALKILYSRGLSDPLIHSFGLGYAPASRQWLHSFLIKKGYSNTFLAQSGLFSKSDPTWPLFANRIMFPIRDTKGRVVAFGGRNLDNEGPKYINSPETIIFKKQETLFAFSHALETIKQKDEAIVCEGYMDALSFHAAGLTNAVAPLGTAFTSHQAMLIRRRASRSILCFDTDSAGLIAAERACAIATAAGLEASVLMLSEGKDASEILEKKGAGELTRMAKNTINAGHFLLERASKNFDISTMEGKSKAVSFLFPFLDALDSDVRRQEYMKEIGKEFGVSPRAVEMDYNRAKATGAFRQRTDTAQHLSPNAAISARTADIVFLAAVILSEDPFQILSTGLTIENLEDTRARDLYAAIVDAHKENVRDIDGILSFCTDDSAVRFVREIDASGELHDNLERIIQDSLQQKRKSALEKERQRLVGKLHQGFETETEKKILEDIMKIDAELKITGGDINE